MDRGIVEDALRELEASGITSLTVIQAINVLFRVYHLSYFFMPNSTDAIPGADPTHYQTFLGSRPEVLERDAIDLVIFAQRSAPSVRCHIVHLSAASALPALRAAKSAGARLTIETHFHYLVLASETPILYDQFIDCTDGYVERRLYSAPCPDVALLRLPVHTSNESSFRGMEDLPAA